MNAENIVTESLRVQTAHLVARSGAIKGSFELQEFTIIGRDSAVQIQIEDNLVSGRHARIERKTDGYYLKDLRTKTGTFLNNTMIIEAKLQNYDRVKIGSTEFFFSYEKEPEIPEVFTTSKNQAWNTQLQRLPTIALSPQPVLITGQSGTGKEMISQMIHKFSTRSRGPFLSVNCSALSESLAESELFGHKKGSFTGSQEARKGAFSSCDGGTLFLDEIGDMPLSIQPKFLRALENCEIKPVGSDQTEKVDVRIVAATNKNLAELVRQGRFREDLYYRIHIVQIMTPTLRDRYEDFETLVHFFARPLKVRFTPDALACLREHHWPGNVRELKNAILRASALFPAGLITKNEMNDVLDVLHRQISNSSNGPRPVISKRELLDYEREVIIERLSMHDGNQRKAAEDMGIAKSTLNDRIKRYGINVLTFKKANYPKKEGG
jgi:transcriptional regulator with PAS, ATPase and Fis domain